MSRAARLLMAHWYAPLFVVMVISVWLLARTTAFMAPGGEAALVADLCLTAPLLYVACYGRRQSLGKTLLRALAISCAGVLLASWLIPAHQQILLPRLAPLRWAGLVLIMIFEIQMVLAVTRIAFTAAATPRKLMDAGDAPEWLARLMLLEAHFWRRLWRVIGGRDKPGP